VKATPDASASLRSAVPAAGRSEAQAVSGASTAGTSVVNLGRRLEFRHAPNEAALQAAHRYRREHLAAASTDEARAERLTERHRPSLDPLKANSTDRRPCGGGWLYSESTGALVEMHCDSWDCRGCAKRLRACAASTIRLGAALVPDDLALCFLTFTDLADARLTLPSLAKTWNRTNLALRRSIDMACYALTVEVQARGALHIHVVAAVPHDVAAMMRAAGQRKRTPAQYGFHFDFLVPLAERLGWGPVCDAQAMREGADQAAAYAVKSLAGYATKGSSLIDGFSYERLRPFRTSQDWPVSFTEVKAMRPDDADPGPWSVVKVVT